MANLYGMFYIPLLPREHLTCQRLYRRLYILSTQQEELDVDESACYVYDMMETSKCVNHPSIQFRRVVLNEYVKPTIIAKIMNVEEHDLITLDEEDEIIKGVERHRKVYHPAVYKDGMTWTHWLFGKYYFHLHRWG